MFGPGQGDVEVAEDLALGVGESVPGAAARRNLSGVVAFSAFDIADKSRESTVSCLPEPDRSLIVAVQYAVQYMNVAT